MSRIRGRRRVDALAASGISSHVIFLSPNSSPRALRLYPSHRSSPAHNNRKQNHVCTSWPSIRVRVESRLAQTRQAHTQRTSQFAKMPNHAQQRSDMRQDLPAKTNHAISSCIFDVAHKPVAHLSSLHPMSSSSPTPQQPITSHPVSSFFLRSVATCHWTSFSYSRPVAQK